jgi:small subunit ribosomal protein S8
MITDPIADYLTQIRNAIQAKHTVVKIKSSSVKKRITEVLCDQGYIKEYQFEDNNGPQGMLNIVLKYAPKTHTPAITKITRISKPGCRSYKKVEELPRVLNGLGISILSTSQGIMTNKEARKRNIGGEELCQIY